MKTKRIGVVTWFGGSNYGTSLQAFALCFSLQKLGVTPYLLKRYKTWRNLIGGILRDVKGMFHSSTSVGLSTGKKRKICQFKKENFYQFVQCIGFLGAIIYKKQIASLDGVISGSDQLWNPYHTDSFLLLENFDIQKYSYASSIGVTEIPMDRKTLYKRALASYSAISVREESALAPLGELYPGKITKVLDPTFLLTKEQWGEFSHKSKLRFDINTPYILVYFIADNNKYWNRIDIIKRETGIERILILPMHPNHFRSGMEIINNAGIYDFVYLLNHATLVCTDSFHATAISINLEVDFVTFLRFKSNEKTSQNSRLTTLLDRYNLNSRLYENDSKGYLVSTDFSKSRTMLLQEREESFSYLQSIIKSC